MRGRRDRGALAEDAAGSVVERDDPTSTAAPVAGTERSQVAGPETEPAAAPSTAPAAVPATLVGRRRRVRLGGLRALVAVLLVTALVATALAIVEGRRLHTRDARERARTAATAAATVALPGIGDFDFSKLTADSARAHALITPGFTKEYDTYFGNQLATLATQRKAVSAFTVVGAQVKQVQTVNKVDVYVLALQDTQYGDGAPRKLVPFALVLTMQRTGGRWLVGNIGQ